MEQGRAGRAEHAAPISIAGSHAGRCGPLTGCCPQSREVKSDPRSHRKTDFSDAAPSELTMFW